MSTNSADAGGVAASRSGSRRWAACSVWLHPLCFAIFPLLSLYAANVDQVPYPDVVLPLLITLSGTLVCAALLFVLMRQAARVAVLLTTGLFLFLSYGHVVDLVGNGPSDWGRQFPLALHLILLAIWLLFSAGVIAAALRIRAASLGSLNSILNIVGVVLLVLPVSTVAQRALEDHGLIQQMGSGTGLPDPMPETLARLRTTKFSPPTAAAPDIYYIILDGYGRADVLQKFYGYDNAPFLDALRQRGFFVAKRSRPNYGQTIESISSSLNMTYLDGVAAKVKANESSYAPLSAMVDNNAVFASLRKHDYHFVAVTTGFSLTAPESATPLLGVESHSTHRTLRPFDALALNLTPLEILPQKETTLYDYHRDELLEGFQDIARIPQLPFRKFVFAHILAPHPPFVFGPNGEHLSHDHPYAISDGSDFMRHGKRADYRQQYIGQLQYVNKQVLETVDAIYKGSPVRPIILIQGDHGPRMFVDWESLKNTDIRETYGNLSTFELPDGQAAQVFSDDITPVNSFRLLLDHVFGDTYPRLPDRSYYSTLGMPYRFTDITDRLPRELSSPPPSPLPRVSIREMDDRNERGSQKRNRRFSSN